MTTSIFYSRPASAKNFFVPDTSSIQTILPHRFLDKKIPALWRSRGICKDIKDQHLHIFHGLSQELPVGIEKTGAKSVVTMHDAIFVRYPELYDPFYRTIFTRKNRYSCKVADRIIAISEQTKSDVIEFFGADESKIDIVYQGCNNIFRQPVSNEQVDAVKKKYNLPNDFIVTVGAIEKRKNQGIILDALHQGRIDIPLVIIGGKTKYSDEITQKTNEYSLEQQIVVLNNVSTEDLPAIYHAALCMIYPSLFEGFGIPILESPLFTNTSHNIGRKLFRRNRRRRGIIYQSEQSRRRCRQVRQSTLERGATQNNDCKRIDTRRQIHRR